MNGVSCNSTASVKACQAAKLAINEQLSLTDVCLFENRAEEHPNVDFVLFRTSPSPGWIPSSARRPNYAGPSNVTMAVACALSPGMLAEATWTPGTPEACVAAVDTSGYSGRWVVDNGATFCVSAHAY